MRTYVHTVPKANRYPQLTVVPLIAQQYTPVSSSATVISSEGLVSVSMVPFLVHCILVPGGGGCDIQLNVIESPTLRSKLVI